MESPAPSESGEPTMRLLVVSHECSPAQAEYQKLRVSPGSMSNLFYKDATPRGDHFMLCTVKLIGREHETEAVRRVVPLKLTLCYDDGQPIEAVDHGSLRVLSSNSHLKAAIPANEDHVTFSYRIELGSFRRADRSFAVRVEADLDAAHRPSSYASVAMCRSIEPCITPAVYVLSKKKLSDHQQQPPLVPPSSYARNYPPPVPMNTGVPMKRKFTDLGDYDEPDQLRTLRWSNTAAPTVPVVEQRADDHQILYRLNQIEAQVSHILGVLAKITNAFEPPPVSLPLDPVAANLPSHVPPPDLHEPRPNFFSPQNSPRSASYNVSRIIPFPDDPNIVNAPSTVLQPAAPTRGPHHGPNIVPC